MAEQGFSNTRNLISLSDTLQLCHNKKSTALIEAVYEGIAGHLWLEDGDIVHATVKQLSGEEALHALLPWDECAISELPYRQPEVRSITKPTPHLLLDAASAYDKRLAEQAELGQNLNNAVEIGKNVWWVGHRKPGSPLQINVYLKKFESKGRKPIWMLIDPGSQVYFPDISRRISELVDIFSIQLFTVNHQDPDVCSNATFITEMNPKAICITTETTSRLVSHYGINKFWFLEDRKWLLRLVTGHTLKFFPTPFCHFAGAFGIYDPESDIVFTGDLFGATSLHYSGAPLYAVPEQWKDVTTFHTIYMPTNAALRVAIDNMSATVGVPSMIAPQHGGVIQGAMVKDWIGKLYELPVGVDLLLQESKGRAGDYQLAIRAIFEGACELIPDLSFAEVVTQSPILARYAAQDDGGELVITGNPKTAVTELVRGLIFGRDRGTVGAVKAVAVRALKNRNLPIDLLNGQDGKNQEMEEDVLEV